MSFEENNQLNNFESGEASVSEQNFYKKDVSIIVFSW